jgi:hypothetical protein
MVATPAVHRRPADQRRVHQPLERAQVGPAHRSEPVAVERRPELGDPGQAASVVGRQPCPAPVQRTSQPIRAGTVREGRPGGLVEQLTRTVQPGAGRGELERERPALQSTDQLPHGVGILVGGADPRGTLGEQPRGVGLGQRTELEHPDAGRAQAAGDERGRRAKILEELRQLRDHPVGRVQHQQAGVERCPHRAPLGRHPERTRDRGKQGLRLATQRDPARRSARSDTPREGGLADPGRTHDLRHGPRAREQVAHERQLFAPPDHRPPTSVRGRR